jgi:hypothetical protein
MSSKHQPANVLSQIMETLNKMAEEANNGLSQIAGEKSDQAKKDALLAAINNIDDQMENLKYLIARAYGIATD